MSLLYRAVWSDSSTPDSAATVDRLKGLVTEWATEETESGPLTEGTSTFDVSQGRQRTVALRTLGPTAFEVTATDSIAGDPTEWVTTVRVIAEDDTAHLLVDLSMSSDDLARRVAVGRPKVVHELLGATAKPRLGGSRVLQGPLALPAPGVAVLTELLENPNRSLPIIVCTEPLATGDDEWLRDAASIAARAEGVAIVVTLDAPAATSLRNALGMLAIWDGGIRVYAPGVVVRESEGWKHRYYTRARLEAFRQSTVNRIVYAVAQLSTRRRTPEAFGVFSGQEQRPADELIPRQELMVVREGLETDLQLARDEQSSLERELSSTTGHLARLKKALIDHGQTALLWGTEHEEAAAVPDAVQYTSEAAMAAQAYLTQWISLPDSAIRDLDDIDTAPEAYNWGNKTWRGLRALAAYAEDRAGGWSNGGFWEWCASGPLLGWPATPKKLSMTEGETVQNSVKLSRTRIFEVSDEVEPSGRITMLAHLKISEGGGPLAPRVYFHDDTGGTTRKIHVGLIGPHYLVPNKSTN